MDYLKVRNPLKIKKNDYFLSDRREEDGYIDEVFGSTKNK